MMVHYLSVHCSWSIVSCIVLILTELHSHGSLTVLGHHVEAVGIRSRSLITSLPFLFFLPGLCNNSYVVWNVSQRGIRYWWYEINKNKVRDSRSWWHHCSVSSVLEGHDYHSSFRNERHRQSLNEEIRGKSTKHLWDNFFFQNLKTKNMSSNFYLYESWRSSHPQCVCLYSYVCVCVNMLAFVSMFLLVVFVIFYINTSLLSSVIHTSTDWWRTEQRWRGACIWQPAPKPTHLISLAWWDATQHPPPRRPDAAHTAYLLLIWLFSS